MQEAASGAFRLVRGNPGFGLLLAARGVSFFGDGIALVALLVYIQQSSGTATAVAAVLLVADLVPALLAPGAGAAADRYHPRATLVVCETTQAILAILLSRLPSLGLMLAIVALMAGLLLRQGRLPAAPSSHWSPARSCPPPTPCSVPRPTVWRPWRHSSRPCCSRCGMLAAYSSWTRPPSSWQQRCLPGFPPSRTRLRHKGFDPKPSPFRRGSASSGPPLWSARLPSGSLLSSRAPDGRRRPRGPCAREPLCH